jgi:hypothetical protein
VKPRYKIDAEYKRLDGGMGIGSSQLQNEEVSSRADIHPTELHED